MLGCDTRPCNLVQYLMLLESWGLGDGTQLLGPAHTCCAQPKVVWLEQEESQVAKEEEELRQAS